MHTLARLVAALAAVLAIGGGAALAQTADLHGTWEWRGEGLVLTLALEPGGGGSLDGEPIRWTARGDVLAITVDGETIEYRFALGAGDLTLSGGDLDAPARFVRKGGAPKKGIGGKIPGGAPPAPPPATPAPGGDWGDPAPAPAPGPALGASPLAGAWEHRSDAALYRLVLHARGTGSFNGLPLEWSAPRPGALRVTMNGVTVDYACALAGDRLTLSGGDLEQPLAFARAAAPATGGGGGAPPGLVGMWRGPEGTIDLRADGMAFLDGQATAYTATADTITLTGPKGSVQIHFRLDGDTLYVTGAGISAVFEREGGGAGAGAGASTAPAPADAAATPAMARVAGVWVGEEASLDPQHYMSYTQYVILYPDGSVGYQKAEGGATRMQVTEHLERFRSWQSGRVGAGGGDAGRWETDGASIVVRWRLWNGLVSQGQVDPSGAALTLSGMGVLQEGATLTFKRAE